LRGPFPWFGGKSKVAPEVWRAFGDVYNYIEPFAGSLAVLLGRPEDHTNSIETVNDLDHYIVNFWRALQHEPEQVAYHANNPVNEADLTARHIWLVNEGRERIARILGDPDYYDTKVAGWWVQGICCWIGGGWCSGTGKWTSVDGKLFEMNRKENGEDAGVNRQLVHLGNAGQGVNRKRVSLVRYGEGIHRGGLRGVGAGVDTGLAEITAYLSGLAARLRYVRVCCGDWKRVVTEGAMAHGDIIGVFLDPPYDVSMRDGGCYNTDAEHGNVSGEVREWAIANGDNPRLRIALCGYAGEHEMPDTWREYAWKANASYQHRNSDGANKVNRELERIWFSRHCLTEKPAMQNFFDLLEGEK